MAATLLAEGTSTITNCPDILDVPLMAEVLRGLGANVEIDGSTVRITSPDEPKYDADFAAVRQFRASVCVLGPLVGRCKRAKVALPGGDAIGSRPLDMHQAGSAATRRTVQHRARLRGRRSRTFARRGDSARVPVSGCNREHPDGGGGGRGRDHDPQRRTRARRRRPVHDAQPDGCPDRGSRLVDDDDHRCRPAASDGAPGDRRPHRRRDVGDRRGDDPRRHLGHGRRPAAPPVGPAQAARRRSHCHPERRRLPCGPVRAAEGGQRRHPSVPRIPDRPAADGDRAGLASRMAPR